MKRLQITLAFALLSATLFMGCGSDDTNGSQGRAANGPVKYGGVFKMNENEDFRTLYPIAIVDVVGGHIGAQVYEGLVKFNQKDLSVMPGLAYRYETFDNATRFIFHLRKGVMFHDNACFPGGKGREMNAGDVKFSFDKLCAVSKNNLQYANTFKDRVVGANSYYESTEKKAALKDGVSGVVMVDDSTIELKLTRPMPNFLTVLCTQGCWVYPHEAFEKYGDEMRVNCVGTGPFKIKMIKEGESVSLERNPNYWMYDEWNNRLPYLDYVEFHFIKDKRAEIMAFRSKDLDMVYRLPVEMAKDILGELEQAKENSADFALQSNPAMSLTYFGFQTKLKPFDNVKVRQAFNYAIDRQYIADKVLQGDAAPGIYGIVPPSMPQYDYKGVTGYTYDPEKARQLLAEAGYPGGKGFPEVTLQINNGGGDRNTMTAEYVTNKLKENLNITVKIEPMPFAQHMETVFTGKSLFWRFGWIADYPDPETFLTTLYSRHIPATMDEPSSLNSGRYSSPQFDSIFDAAMVEVDPEKRAELFRRADQVAMNDAAIMPIYYEVNDRLIKRNVRGFDINPMEYRDMTKVWFDNSEDGKPGEKKDSVKK
jgi:peptide/nickel transport system substrate-binding protein